MLENKPAWQNRQCVAFDRFRIDRDDWHAEKIADHTEKTLFVDLSGIEHLRGPGTAVHVLRELHRLIARLHAAREQLVETEEHLERAMRDIGFPLALKIQSADLPHKTEVGGVELAIADADSGCVKYREMLQKLKALRPDAVIQGVLVSPMAKPGLEIIIGIIRDELFGPKALVPQRRAAAVPDGPANDRWAARRILRRRTLERPGRAPTPGDDGDCHQPAGARSPGKGAGREPPLGGPARRFLARGTSRHAERQRGHTLSRRHDCAEPRYLRRAGDHERSHSRSCQRTLSVRMTTRERPPSISLVRFGGAVRSHSRVDVTASPIAV